MPRATPLPPNERRAAIIAAAIPLIEERGIRVSTRQIAEAAGVAEGTLFRVFPTKNDLIAAVIENMTDPEPSCTALDAIDRSLPLQQRLELAVQDGQARVRRVVALFQALGPGLRQYQQRAMESHDLRARSAEQRARTVAALARVIEPDQDQLRVSALEAARLLSVITFSLSHPWIAEDHPDNTPQQVVELLLHGITKTSEDTTSTIHSADALRSPDPSAVS